MCWSNGTVFKFLNENNKTAVSNKAYAVSQYGGQPDNMVLLLMVIVAFRTKRNLV